MRVVEGFFEGANPFAGSGQHTGGGQGGGGVGAAGPLLGTGGGAERLGPSLHNGAGRPGVAGALVVLVPVRKGGPDLPYSGFNAAWDVHDAVASAVQGPHGVLR